MMLVYNTCMMQATMRLALIAVLAGSVVAPVAAETATSPFGIAWGFVYGYAGVPAAPFVPLARGLGAGTTKIYLFWNQIEPRPGVYDWSAVDAYCAQLRSPEEGLISVYSASTWATERSTTMLPPSPPKRLDDYARFIGALVRRCNGRVRYWENDAEASDPLYWSGTADQFVDELRVFHRAVKAVDPSALVIAGGYDGWFNPPGLPPITGQEAGLAFYDRVLSQSRDDFDLFDLRLYGDPTTIPGRVAYIRERMQAYGYQKPIVSTEYGGPNPLEFAANRKYYALLTAWAQQVAAHGAGAAPANPLDDMYAHPDALPPETRMFMLDAPPALQAEYERIQGRQLVMRNLFALSAGVQKMIYWQFLGDTGKRGDLMTFMYGKVGMFASGVGRLPIADVFQRMTGELGGAVSVTRVALPADPSVCLFVVERGARGRLAVAWRASGAPSLVHPRATEAAVPWERTGAKAIDAFGNSVTVRVDGGTARLLLSATPVYVE